MTDDPETHRGLSMPRDFGLPGLGLVMQAGGGLMLLVNLALISTAGVLMMGRRGSSSGSEDFLLILGLGVVRSAVHVMAGSKLTSGGYGAGKNVRAYFYVALAHSVVVLGLLRDAKPEALAVLGLQLLLWPCVVFAITARREVQNLFKRVDDGHAAIRDANRGIEGASLLLVVMGGIGTLSGGMILYGLFVTGAGPAMSEDSAIGTTLTILFVALFARGALHLVAGLRGVSASEPDAFVAGVNLYRKAAFASAAVYGVFMALIMFEGGGIGFTFLGTVLGMLLIWPVILHAFASRRASHLDDEGESDRFGPASDRGVTTLGFLLLGMAALNVPPVVGAVLDTGPAGSGLVVGLSMIQGEMPAVVPLFTTATSLWAGVEFVRVGGAVRLSGIVYGVLGFGVAAYNAWESWDLLTNLGMGPDLGFVGLLGGLFGPVVLPGVVLWAALRK